MKKIFFIPMLISIVGCQKQRSTTVESSYVSELLSHTYDEVVEKMIEWKDLFTIDKLDYYTYIYSETCSHCQNIKDQVIDKALKMDNFYFVRYSKEIPIIQNTDFTLNQTDISKMGILGTPSLIEIYNKTSILNVAGEAKITKILANLD